MVAQATSRESSAAVWRTVAWRRGRGQACGMGRKRQGQCSPLLSPQSTPLLLGSVLGFWGGQGQTGRLRRGSQRVIAISPQGPKGNDNHGLKP